VIEFSHGFADGRFFDDLAFVGCGDEQGGGTQAVNQAGNAFSILVDASQGIVGEQGAALVLGKLDVVADISDGLSQVEGGEMVMGGDALVESFVRGEAQNTAKIRLADEQQDPQGLAVHFRCAARRGSRAKKRVWEAERVE